MSCMTSMTSYFPYIIIKNRKKIVSFGCGFLPEKFSYCPKKYCFALLRWWGSADPAGIGLYERRLCQRHLMSRRGYSLIFRDNKLSTFTFTIQLSIVCVTTRVLSIVPPLPIVRPIYQSRKGGGRLWRDWRFRDLTGSCTPCTASSCLQTNFSWWCSGWASDS